LVGRRSLPPKSANRTRRSRKSREIERRARYPEKEGERTQEAIHECKLRFEGRRRKEEALTNVRNIERRGSPVKKGSRK